MRQLEIPLYAAVGLLEAMWNLTARETPQGNIGKLTDHDIADHLGWTKEPSILIDALVQSGWVEGHPDHRLIVHDWHDHADDAVRKSLQRSNLPFLSRNVATIPDRVETKPDKNRLPEPEPCLSLAKPKPEPKAKAPAPPTAPPFVLPEWVSAFTWGAYEEMRKRIRKPMTDTARKLILGKLARIRDGGDDPEAVLNRSIANSWQDVWPLPQGGNDGNRNRNGGGKGQRIVEAAREAISSLAGEETSDFGDGAAGFSGQGNAHVLRLGTVEQRTERFDFGDRQALPQKAG